MYTPDICDGSLAWWKSLDPHTRAVFVQALWQRQGKPKETATPAHTAFAQLASVLVAARIDTDRFDGWVCAQAAQSREIIAYRRCEENHWRVPTQTYAFVRLLGRSAVQRFGRQWADAGWVTCVGDRTTTVDYLPTDVTARVLRIPCAIVNIYRSSAQEVAA